LVGTVRPSLDIGEIYLLAGLGAEMNLQPVLAWRRSITAKAPSPPCAGADEEKARTYRRSAEVQSVSTATS